MVILPMMCETCGLKVDVRSSEGMPCCASCGGKLRPAGKVRQGGDVVPATHYTEQPLTCDLSATYVYFDGGIYQQENVEILAGRLQKVRVELAIHLKVARSQSLHKNVAHNMAVDLARSIFGIRPSLDGGLTEVETLKLLDHFLAYCKLLQRKEV